MSYLRSKPVILEEPIQGGVARKIRALSNQVTNEITRSTKEGQPKLEDLIEMINRDPVVSSSVELKALRATIALGDYKHSNKKIERFINSNFELMQGSLTNCIGKLSHAMPLGFSVAEVVFHTNYRKQWFLKELNVLDPRFVKFKGANGVITHVVYDDGEGGNKYIPYNQCIHITGGFTTNFDDPFGVAEAQRAYPYYKAKQLILAEMVIAAKNNATGIWVGFTDTAQDVRLYGPDGKVINDETGSPAVESSAFNLMKQLTNLENSSVLVTDLKNRIESRQLSSGEQFWNLAITLLDNQITRAFNIPSLTFSEGSSALGQSNLSLQHKNILDSAVEAIVLQIKDNLLEKVVRPLIWLNYGPSESYGDFSQKAVADPSTVSVQIQNLVNASSLGLVDANSADVKKKIYELLDLGELTDEQIQLSQLQQLMTQQQQGQDNTMDQTYL